MVEAAERLVCVFIECDWGKQNADVADHFKVKGYPTVIFCEPDLKIIGTLNARDPASVAKQMLEVAGKFNSKPEAAPKPLELKAYSIPDALAAAAQTKRRALLFFRDESPGSLSVIAALADPAMQEVLTRYVLGTEPFTKGAGLSATWEVTRAPTLLVVDPVQKGNAKVLARIEGSRSAREILRELEPLAVREPTGTPIPSRPEPKAPEEKLSDDQVERLFIQARVTVAQDLMKKGKKDKAIEIYEDLVKTYPKHVDIAAVKKLLEEARK